MHYKEKIRFLAERQKQQDYDMDKYYIDMSIEEPRWKEGELDELLKPYPYVTESYKGFIQEFDCLGLTFLAFYGSKAYRHGGLQENIDDLSEYTDIFKKEYFPFGKDPAGSVFAFNKRGEVIYFDIEDYDFEHPEKIADNFDEFVDECILGKRLEEFLPETSGFYQYVKSLGWA